MKIGIYFGVLALLLSPSINAQNLDDGIALFEQNNLDEAQAIFTSLKKAHPNNAEVYFYLGRIQFSKGEYKKAVNWFDDAADRDKDNSLYPMWMGHSYGRQAQSASMLRQASLARNSRKNYEQAIELDPDNVEARESAMEFYLQAPGFLGGGRDKAESEATQIEKLNLEAGIKAWGRIYTYYDEVEFALFHYQSAIENHPEVMVSYYELFNYHFNNQEYEQAADIAIQQLQINDTTGTIYNNLANAQQRYGLYAQALENYKKAMQLTPELTNSWYQIGRLAAVSGEYLDEGMEYITRFIALGAAVNDNTMAWAHYRKGTIYEHLNQLDNAKKSYELALTFDKNHDETKKALSKID